MSGAFGKHIDRLLTEDGLGDLLQSKSSLKPNIPNRDVLDFVNEFKREALFDYHPGHQHRGFKKYTYKASIKAPSLLGRKLHKIAEEMDMWKTITNYR